MLTIKGAPDILLRRCSTLLAGDRRSCEVTEDDRKAVEHIKDSWSAQGKRVILLARKLLPDRFFTLSTATREYEQQIMKEANNDLELVGLVAIVDPPRDKIPEVVRTLRGAGIKIHMVTGDFKLTAQAIAAECGIITVPLELVDNIAAIHVFEDISHSLDESKKQV